MLYLPEGSQDKSNRSQGFACKKCIKQLKGGGLAIALHLHRSAWAEPQSTFGQRFVSRHPRGPFAASPSGRPQRRPVFSPESLLATSAGATEGVAGETLSPRAAVAKAPAGAALEALGKAGRDRVVVAGPDDCGPRRALCLARSRGCAAAGACSAETATISD